MKKIKKSEGWINGLEKWANTHAYFPIDILKFCLLIFLIYNGIKYFENSEILNELLQKMNFEKYSDSI